MRYRGVLVAGLVLVTGFGAAMATPAFLSPAQEDKAKQEKKAESAEQEEAKEEKVATPAADAVKARVKAYNDETKAFMKKVQDPEWMKAYRAAAAEGRESAAKFLAEAGQPDRSKYIAEMDEVAAQSLAFLAANKRGPQSQQIVDLLFSQYSNSPAIELVVPMATMNRAKAEPRLRKLLRSPHARVKALATISLADYLARQNPEDTTEVEALYTSVMEDYADVEDARGPIADRAKNSLFEIQHLSIGKVAPDIAAADLDGVDFKLTDYRGKVVLLDFWGNW